MLLELRRRFGTWRAPAIGLAVFTGMFALSTLVLGPAIGDATGPGPAVQQPVDGHDTHHS